MSAAVTEPVAKPFDGKEERQSASRAPHMRFRAVSRARGCRVRFFRNLC